MSVFVFRIKAKANC